MTDKEMIQKLRECVEFYANRKNWGGWNIYVGEKLRSMDTMRQDTDEGQDTDGFKCLIGGKKARDTLIELDMPKVSGTEK